MRGRWMGDILSNGVRKSCSDRAHVGNETITNSIFVASNARYQFLKIDHEEKWPRQNKPQKSRRV